MHLPCEEAIVYLNLLAHTTTEIQAANSDRHKCNIIGFRGHQSVNTIDVRPSLIFLHATLIN